MAREDIFVIESGQTIEFDENGARRGEDVPGEYIYVDGLGVGDIGAAVLRERRSLAHAGFISVMVATDADGVAEPKIELATRGFVFRPDSESLLDEMQSFVRRLVIAAEDPSPGLDAEIRRRLGDHVYERTKRRPEIIVRLLKV